MQIQKLPLLFVFSLAFAARGICAEDTLHWTWCQILPFLRFCKKEEPENPCTRMLRRSGARCLFGLLCKNDDENANKAPTCP